MRKTFVKRRAVVERRTREFSMEEFICDHFGALMLSGIALMLIGVGIEARFFL